MPSASLNPHRRIAGALVLLCVLKFSVAAAAPPPREGERLVTYIAGDRVYLAAGNDMSLKVGDELKITRNGAPVATVRVLQVNDTSCAAAVVDRTKFIQPGDEVMLSLPVRQTPPESAMPPATGARIDTSDQPSPDSLGAAWTTALSQSPPVRYPYRTQVDSTDPGKRLSAGVKTSVRQYSYFQSSRYLQTEQSVYFHARGNSQRDSGMWEWAVNGEVRGRYDDRPDYYLKDQRVIPLIRQLSVSYQGRRHPFRLMLGRFSPDVPIVHTIDGAAAELLTRQFSISVFGGLQPDALQLEPTVKRQTFGIAAQVHPFGSATYTLEAVAMAQLYQGHFYRSALGLNNHYFRAKKFRLTETAVLDLLSAKSETKAGGDVTLSHAAVDMEWPLSQRVKMDVRARYSRQVLFAEDYSSLADEWLSYIDRYGDGRVEVGVPIVTPRKRNIRPFAFGRAGLDPGGVDDGLGGAGVSIHHDRMFSTRTGITTVLDYGIGAGQIANVNVTLNTPLKNNRLSLLSGLYTTWQHAYNSQINTFRNLAFLMLRGRLRRNMDITADWHTGYDHGLVRLSYPIGVWMQFQLGISAYY